MIRTLVIASVMLAPPDRLLQKEVTVRGCTSSGFAGCSLLKVGKESLMLTGKAGVVIPPSNTYVDRDGNDRPRGTECLQRRKADHREQDRRDQAQVQIRS